MERVLSRLAAGGELLGRPLDLLYSRLGGLNGQFFPAGFGNLGIVRLDEDVELIRHWPPVNQMQIAWRLLEEGAWDGTPYRLLEGSFKTPCINRIYDALPRESRTGRVQLLVPAGPPGSSSSSVGGGALAGGASSPKRPRTLPWPLRSPGAACSAAEPPGAREGSALFGDAAAMRAAVLHLAATGDQGWGRRLRLGGPLLAQGVTTLVLESPYYGARRPSHQSGSKLCAVSDLLALGWATIYESLCLLHWLEASGVEARGISGLSMGGVHAAMTAGLYPRPLAVAPLLTPRSAAVAYCDGALAPLVAWQALLARDTADNEVEQVVAAAAQPVSLLSLARHVQLTDKQQSQQQQQQQTQLAQEVARVEQQQEARAAALQRQLDGTQLQQAVGPELQRQLGLADVSAAAWQQQEQAAAIAAVGEAAEAEQQAADAAAARSDAAVAAMAAAVSDLQQGAPAQQPGTAAAASVSSSSASSSWRSQVWRWRRSSLSAASGPGAAPGPGPGPDPDTFRRLRHVLETYTDVSRFPRPVRPDAAVLVAARDDGYVPAASVQALQAHWPGSELRLVPGGHVSAFLLHQAAFRAAIADSLARLRGPAPQQGAQRAE